MSWWSYAQFTTVLSNTATPYNVLTQTLRDLAPSSVMSASITRLGIFLGGAFRRMRYTLEILLELSTETISPTSTKT